MGWLVGILGGIATLTLMPQAEGQWVQVQETAEQDGALDPKDPLGLNTPQGVFVIDGEWRWEDAQEMALSLNSLQGFGDVYDNVRAELAAHRAALVASLDPRDPETDAILRKFRVGSRRVLLGVQQRGLEPSETPEGKTWEFANFWNKPNVDALTETRSSARIQLRFEPFWGRLIRKTLTNDQQVKLARHINSPVADFHFCLSKSVVTMGLALNLVRGRIDSLEEHVVEELRRIDAQAHGVIREGIAFEKSAKVDAEMRVRNLSDALLSRVLNAEEIERWHAVKDQYLTRHWSLLEFPPIPSTYEWHLIGK